MGIKERPDGVQAQKIEVVDLREELRRGNRSIISRSLYEKIQERLERKEQMMLLSTAGDLTALYRAGHVVRQSNVQDVMWR